MKEKDYERQYDELYRKLEDNREQQWELQQMQTQVHDEEDDNDEAIRLFGEFNRDMEDDWRDRNMLGDHDYLFDNDMCLMNNINSERNYLWNEDEEMKNHLKKLRYDEEGYENEMSRLTRRYEDEKEEDHGQDY